MYGYRRPWFLFVFLGVAAIFFVSLVLTLAWPHGYFGYPIYFFPFGLFWFFPIWFFVFFIPWGYRRPGAYAILRERYARGEITKEQFEQMTKDLEESWRRSTQGHD